MRRLLPEDARVIGVERFPVFPHAPPLTSLEWARLLVTNKYRTPIYSKGLALWYRLDDGRARKLLFRVVERPTSCDRQPGFVFVPGKSCVPGMLAAISTPAGTRKRLFEGGEVLGFTARLVNATGANSRDVLVFEGGWGTSATGVWRIFHARGRRLRQIFHLYAFDAAVRVKDGRVIVRRTLYRPKEMHCCATRYRIVKRRWNGSRFVVFSSRTKRIR